MSSGRSQRSQYEALPTRSNSEDGPLPTLVSPAQPRRGPTKSALAVEVDTLFRRWTTTIAERMKSKKRRGRKGTAVEERDREKAVEIMASVFEVYEPPPSQGKGKEKELDEDQRVMTLDHEPPMTREAFDE